MHNLPQFVKQIILKLRGFLITAAVASRSENGDLAAVYCPVGNEIVNRPGLLKKALRAEWFNPRSGERFIARSKAPNRYRTPDDNDWIHTVLAKCAFSPNQQGTSCILLNSLEPRVTLHSRTAFKPSRGTSCWPS